MGEGLALGDAEKQWGSREFELGSSELQLQV